MRTPQVAAVTLVAFLMALLAPYVARADTPAHPAPAVSDDALNQAKQHFEAGKNAYNAGDYITSIREFKAAEALRPSPILAYNIGLANEKLGKKRVALKYFHRYLDQMPNAQNRPEVEGRIAQLDADIAAQPPPPLPNQPPPPGQPGVAVEQPGDMPPPQQGAPPASYDPYGSTAPNNGAVPAPPKKKSHWWVWLIVAGGATLVIAVVVALAVVYGDTSTVFADRAMLTNTRDPSNSSGRTSSNLLPLIHF